MSKPTLTLIVNPNPEKPETKATEAVCEKFYATLVFHEYTLPSGDKPILVSPEFAEKISDWAKGQVDPMQARHHVQTFLMDYGIRLRRAILKELKDGLKP